MVSKGPTKPSGGPTSDKDEGLRLMEVTAALRREFEAVALIAAPEDREVPQFQLCEVELNMNYIVTGIDDDGVRVEIDRDEIAKAPQNTVHNARLKFVDLDVSDLAQKSDGRADVE